MRRVLLGATVIVTLTGCADMISPGPEHMTSPTASTPKETIKIDARYVSTIKKGTVGVIADDPWEIIAGVPNVTTDGRTALAVTIQGRGAYGNIYLRNGEDFQIEGIPFHIETFPESGKVTIYQLPSDTGRDSAPQTPRT